MKHLLLTIILCLNCISIQAQVDFFYQSKSAGDFAVYTGKKHETASHLKIKGPFNQADFKRLTEICKANKQIKTIDIKGITNITHIPDKAFEDCVNLKEIMLPQQISSIGDYAFSYCTSLKKIAWGDHIKEIGEYAFFKCESLRDITIKNALTTIKRNAFDGCSRLTNLTLPPTTTNILDECFKACVCLKSITCHSKQAPICSLSAFQGCDVISCVLYVPQESIQEYEEKPIWATFDRTYPIPEEKSFGHVITPINQEKVSLNIKSPNSIKNCDADLQKVNHLIIRGMVTKQDLKDLGDRLRTDWKQIKTIELNHNTGTSSIPDNCFANCDNLISVHISKKIKHLGDSCFHRCKNLTRVSLPFTVEQIGDHCFSYCDNLATIELPYRLKGIGAKAFYGCKSIKTLTIPQGVETIKEQTFFHCENLKKILFPQKLKKIERASFMGCYALDSIFIPDSITNLEESTFEDCLSMRSIKFSRNTIKIGNKCFLGCKTLTSITLPDKVEQIGDWAFKGCLSLKRIQLSAQLNTISEMAFSQCNNLRSIELHCTNPPKIYSNSFDAITKSNSTVIVPNDGYSLYLLSDQWWTFSNIKQREE